MYLNTVPATTFDETRGNEAVSAAKVSQAQRRRRSDPAPRKLVREDDDEDDSVRSAFQKLLRLNFWTGHDLLIMLNHTKAQKAKSKPSQGDARIMYRPRQWHAKVKENDLRSNRNHAIVLPRQLQKITLKDNLTLKDNVKR